MKSWGASMSGTRKSHRSVRPLMTTSKEPVPPISHTGTPFRGILSKGWVLTGRVNKVGAVLIGTGYMLGGGACIVCGFGLITEMQDTVGNGRFVTILSSLLVLGALGIGVCLLGLGARFLHGALSSKSRHV
jgi:hypothetical protein